MANKQNITNDDIIKCVEEIISVDGTNCFSLRDVAKKMHISKGTLYYHYKSKDSLILDVMEKHMAELSHDYVEWLEKHKKDGLTQDRFLEIVLYKGVKLFNKAKIHIYLINECMAGNKELTSKYKELWLKWQNELQEGIEQVFPDVKDKKVYAHFLMTVIDGLTIQEALQTENTNTNEIIKYMEEIK